MAQQSLTDADIITALQASGYLLEQDVATVLESHDFLVQTSRAFLDPDEGKSREMDVWAYKQVFRDEGQRLSVSLELICECKNKGNPLVFLSRLRNRADRSAVPNEYVFPVAESIGYVPPGVSDFQTRPFYRLGLDKQHYYYSQDTKYVQFCVLSQKGKVWQANHNGLYDSVFYPLVKAMTYRRNEMHGSIDTKTSGGWRNVWLFFMLAVFTCDMFRMGATTNLLRVQPTEHVMFTRELSSKSINGKFAVDFVTLAGLSAAVTGSIMPFAEATAALLQASPDQFIEARQPRP